MRTHHIEGHPVWLRAASRRIARELRRMRRRTWLDRHGNKVVSGLALLAIAALLVGVYATRKPVPEPAPAAAPSTISRVDLADPFRNTPAETWADGEAGLTPPEAAPVGPFSAQQVADAYRRARAAVVAARLDRRVLEGHDVEPLLSLFAVDDQEGLRPLFAGGRDDEAGLIATRVASGWALLPVAPKVDGAMTAEAKGPGELVVHTDYVFAYAFATPDVEKLRGPMDIVAVTRIRYDYVMRSGPDFRPESQGMWSGPATGHSYSIGCTASREGFLAPSIAEPRTQRGSTQEEGRPEDYFDPDKPMPTINTCPG
ncbi:hypothetical protein [Umezawaea tangerina]|uniref:hypothetical protein n=1 Tax=Umezawaea tangerina TaxID=84725 RepID=UPI0011B1D11C|nr:hypothetical protein [Umezawaea tangerina]